MNLLLIMSLCLRILTTLNVLWLCQVVIILLLNLHLNSFVLVKSLSILILQNWQVCNMKGAPLNRNHNLAFLLEKVLSLPLSEYSIFIKRLEQCSGLGFSKLTRAQQLLFLKCLELNSSECSDVIDFIDVLHGGK